MADGGSSTMYITKTSVDKKELIHERRVVATYSLLKNVTPQRLADHTLWNIRLDHIADLSCKPPLLKSQTEDPDQLGTGVLTLKKIELTTQYLNVEYEYAGSDPDINLWFDDTNHPTSNIWIASLCINTSATESTTKGYVSFDVGKLFRETSESRYALNPGPWGYDHLPKQLILRYYESAGKQKELHYTIEYDVHGMGLREVKND